MLSVLSMRVWREGMVGPRVDAKDSAAAGRQGHVAVVVGNLQDTYQEFQYQVSAKLARYYICATILQPFESSNAPALS